MKVKFSFKGKSETVDAAEDISSSALLTLARESLQIDDDIILKLLFKGKTIAQQHLPGSSVAEEDTRRAFPEGVKIPKGGAKVFVMGTVTSGIKTLNSMQSDPLMRGFDEEKLKNSNAKGPMSTFWGPKFGNQHAKYKFCRLEECKDASFGTRPTSSTPHAFEARRLLERLATDPGIVQILTSRQLVVGCFGEMDPIDDRLMQKKQQEGGCLLGYNTNHGLRIDIKLRTDDLSGFRPYNELASTLIHEISHNWVSEHDALFWTNFGQMRVEYLWKHACLMMGGLLVDGKSTASLALVTDMIVSPTDERSSPSKTKFMDNICISVINEFAREMAQHGLPVQTVAPAVVGFSKDLMIETKDDYIGMSQGQRLGSSSNDENSGLSARERALAAAEKRAREAREGK